MFSLDKPLEHFLVATIPVPGISLTHLGSGHSGHTEGVIVEASAGVAAELPQPAVLVSVAPPQPVGQGDSGGEYHGADDEEDEAEGGQSAPVTRHAD